jgi:hypothetical protein
LPWLAVLTGKSLNLRGFFEMANYSFLNSYLAGC